MILKDILDRYHGGEVQRVYPCLVGDATGPLDLITLLHCGKICLFLDSGLAREQLRGAYNMQPPGWLLQRLIDMTNFSSVANVMFLH